MVLEASGCWRRTSCDVTIIHHLLLSLFYGLDAWDYKDAEDIPVQLVGNAASAPH